MEGTCSTCPAYHPDGTTPDKARVGECRANPPIVLAEGPSDDSFGISGWPRTGAADWCMKHPDRRGSAVVHVVELPPPAVPEGMIEEDVVPGPSFDVGCEVDDTRSGHPLLPLLHANALWAIRPIQAAVRTPKEGEDLGDPVLLAMRVVSPPTWAREALPDPGAVHYYASSLFSVLGPAGSVLGPAGSVAYLDTEPVAVPIEDGDWLLVVKAVLRKGVHPVEVDTAAGCRITCPEGGVPWTYGDADVWERPPWYAKEVTDD